MLPKIFIASPLFNKIQHAQIQILEDACNAAGFEYYSARHDSEPFIPKGDDKKNPAAWEPVFRNNMEGLESCDIMIANLAYSLPEDQHMGIGSGIQDPFEHGWRMADFKRVELPDSGTVWEMGTFRGMGKVVIGWHPVKRGDHLNLMLTHGCDALVSGVDNVQKFLDQELASSQGVPSTIYDRFYNSEVENDSFWDMMTYFNWSVIEQWAAQNDGGLT